MHVPTVAGRPKVVIVGGGFGGLAAAQALGGEAVDVVLVDRRNHHLFQPLLYQVATAGLSPSNIAQPIRSILKRKRNVTTLMGEVVGIDRDKRTVTLADGELAYDFLVLACGVRSHYFGHDEWAAHAPGLKTITDALELRARTLMAFEAAERCTDEVERRRLLTFVVVGAGPTGVEMAGAIADIARSVLHQDYRAIDSAQARVLLVEGGPRVLPSYDARLSASAKSQLEKIGVEVRLDTRVEQIDAQGVLAGGERIDAAVVVWAAGLRAEDVYGALGVERDRMGRVRVEPTLRVIGCEREFAIGDGSLLEEGGVALPGVAPVATQQGVLVARNVLRAVRGEALVNFRYRDKGQMATIGRARAVAASGKLRMTGFIAWLAWLFIHLLFLVGLQNRVLVFSQWVYAYLASKRSARLIVEPIAAPQPRA